MWVGSSFKCCILRAPRLGWTEFSRFNVQPLRRLQPRNGECRVASKFLLHLQLSSWYGPWPPLTHPRVAERRPSALRSFPALPLLICRLFVCDCPWLLGVGHPETLDLSFPHTKAPPLRSRPITQCGERTYHTRICEQGPIQRQEEVGEILSSFLSLIWYMFIVGHKREVFIWKWFYRRFKPSKLKHIYKSQSFHNFVKKGKSKSLHSWLTSRVSVLLLGLGARFKYAIKQS